MVDENRKKLFITTIVYWVLLLYVIAALTWWSYELVKQTEAIYHLKKASLQQQVSPNSVEYQQQLFKIEDQRRRNIYKYIGEGATFLLLILFGAVFIYRSVRRQFRLHLQQQNFVMAITHELKTPIAVSKLNLETMLKYRLDDEKKEKLLQMNLQETLRLDNLINNILISSQLEGNSYRMQKDEMNFSELLQQLLQQFSQRYPQRKLNAKIQEQIIVDGDPLLLKLLASNLLENAAKYSPAEKPIMVELTAGGMAELTIADEGPGIPIGERKNIFKKFYRLGSETTRRTQGTGLGLFICKKIVHDHNGNISVKENQPEGSKFIVQLPMSAHGK